MSDYKNQFIQLAIEYQALKFGEFKLKSGRLSPYFFNAGVFNTGRALASLGSVYARSYIDQDLECDVLFGPAYKGIPLVSALAIALSSSHALDLPYAFNRKEAKDHGEGGTIVGAPLEGDVIIIDDVITAGTAIREAVNIIQAEGGKAKAVLIALDRQEKGSGDKSAIQEIQDECGINVHSIITLDDLITFIKMADSYSQYLPAMQSYRDEYGV